MEMEFFVKPGTDEEWHQYWIDERTRLVHRPRPDAGEPAPLRAPAGEAVALLEAHRRYRVSVRLRRLASGVSSRASPTGPTSTSRTHSEHSGVDLSYFDPATGERYVPYVIEPAAGPNRAMMAFLVDAYDEDEAPNTKGGVDKRTVLRLDPRLAPVKVAVLPLSRNEALSPKARDLAAELRQSWNVDFDDAQADRPSLPPAG